jgi:hypothetical protein
VLLGSPWDQIIIRTHLLGRSRPPPSFHNKSHASQNPHPCSDIDDCKVGSPCSPDADCHDTPGGYLCTCKPGFSGDGATCRDALPPTLTIADGGRPVLGFARADEGAAPVRFPAMTPADAVSTDASKIEVECSAVVDNSGSQVGRPENDPKGATLFPVGTTLVSCVATDEAGNPSPPATFAVEVMCPEGFALKKGKCTGAWWIG